VVSFAQSVRSHGRERLSLPDAALGMLFAWIVLGEHVEVRDLMGIVPVALGIYLVTRPAATSRSKAARSESP